MNREKRSLPGRSVERGLMAEVVQHEEHQIEKIPYVSLSRGEDLRTKLKRIRNRREEEDMRTTWKKSRGNERMVDNVKKLELSELKLSRVRNLDE